VALAAATDFKRVTLEMGGNDPAIILDDADIESTVAALLMVSLLNCGQICCIPKRIFAPAALYSQIVEAFASAAKAVVVGPPDGEDAQMRPLSTRPQFERVSELVAEAISGGARVAAGGPPETRLNLAGARSATVLRVDEPFIVW
jgi:acyl-CoA reductase-like NAD-dependent aldehyde dehydrogenase